MCTSFTLTSTNGDVIYGRTLEFTLQLRSEVIAVPVGAELMGTGLAGDPGVGGRTWTATRAAVGMNALGLRMVIDGQNDAGLVAAAFNFPVSAAFEAITAKQESQAIGCHEVPLYLLTTCSTVAECRAALADVRVHGPHMAAYGGQVPMLHFAVHDATGASVVLEWTRGRLDVYENPTTVLTNEPPFPMQLAHLAEYSYLSAEPPELGAACRPCRAGSSPPTASCAPSGPRAPRPPSTHPRRASSTRATSSTASTSRPGP